MANNELRTKIVLRNDTPVNWTAEDPTLLKGEIGVEVAENGDLRVKVGNGSDAWTALPYFGETEIPEAQVFFANVAFGGDKVAALEAVATAPIDGDVGIVKMPIFEGSDKLEHTAFVYSNGDWYAMDGNYHADNVYFNEDLTYTANIGALTLDGASSKSLSAKGKTLEEVLKSILAKRILPSVTQPGATVNSSNIGAKEVGENVAVQYSLAFTKGSYTYGPTSNTPETAYSATFNGETLTTKTGTFASVQVTDTTNLSISGSISYGEDTVIPKDNLGDECLDKKIAAGSASGSKGALTGYRNWFMYVGTDYNTALDGTFLRANATKKGSGKNASNQVNVTIPAGTNRVIIAIPKGTGYTKKLKDVIDVDGMGLSVFANFTLSDVAVEGANNFTAMDYNVWEMKAPTSAGVAATRYTFTIN